MQATWTKWFHHMQTSNKALTMTVSSRETASKGCTCNQGSSMHDTDKGQGTWHNAPHEHQVPAPVGKHLWKNMQENTANSSTSIAEVPRRPCRGIANGHTF
eukprot:6455504-Amphidinium_carterae.3